MDFFILRSLIWYEAINKMADIELMLIETIDDGNCEINKIRKTSPVTKSEFQSHDFENPINSRYPYFL